MPTIDTVCTSSDRSTCGFQRRFASICEEALHRRRHKPNTSGRPPPRAQQPNTPKINYTYVSCRPAVILRWMLSEVSNADHLVNSQTLIGGLVTEDNKAKEAPEAEQPRVPLSHTEKGALAIPPAGTAIPWWALAIGRTGKYLLTYVVPVYLIIGAIVIIALPAGSSLRIWPFTSSNAGSPPSVPTNVAVPATPVPNARIATAAKEEPKVTEIAKLAIDATKERVDMMKESYDKIFSFIAALGALLAFFGFKGLETFMTTRARAEEATTQAEEAARDAALAKQEAKDAIRSLDDFLKHKYIIDTSAEINASHGIVLREIADLYKSISDLVAQNNPKTQEEYRKYLRSSLYYLDLATENAQDIAPRVLSRVYGTKGNVYRRLEDYSLALQAAQNALKVNPQDHSALYNSACYEALLSVQEKQKSDHGAASDYEDAMIRHLREAIALRDHYRHDAKKEVDFSEFQKNSHFLHAIEEK